MQKVTPKEQMLKNIRKALIEKKDNPYAIQNEIVSIYPTKDEEITLIFAEEFTKVNGNFIFCENEPTFNTYLKQVWEQNQWTEVHCWEPTLQLILNQNNLPYNAKDDNFDIANVGITTCEALEARTGSIFISNANNAGRRLSIYPHIHIVVAYTSQLKPDIKEAIQYIQTRYKGKAPSMISAITGPSRTADIEKTLVLGAHGPKELFLFLIDDTP